MPAITRSARSRAPAGSSGAHRQGNRSASADARAHEGRPVLRLALSGGALAIELDEPARLGPLVVTDLSVALESVTFPIDLSGGVPRFRHRRGRLRRLAVEARPLDLASAMAPRLSGLLGAATPELVLAPAVDGLMVGVRSGRSALAFDLLAAPMDEDLRLLVQRARGMGLSAPPFVVAVRAAGAVLGSLAERRGGAYVVRRVGGKVALRLLPEAGARAPVTEGLRFEALGGDLTRLWLDASDGAVVPALSDAVLSALELAELASDADERALGGDLDGARHAYMTLLERAPRHPELSQRVAWIDRVAGGRAEAALSTILDVTSAVDAGILGAELLAEVGDEDGASIAMMRAGITEPYGALAALALLRASALTTDEATRLSAIDEAIARAPGMAEARWARLEDRLQRSDRSAAKADAEHLEAAAVGRTSRFDVCNRVADAFFARGFVRDAQALYERALRYAPDDARAVLGLARTLRELGQERRAIDLFARAVTLAERRGIRLLSAELELARALAEIAHDRPAAVARARGIPADALEAPEARLLEARWRAELGDLAGAAIALGRLRDAVERSGTIEPDRAGTLAALLLEAAVLDERARADVAAAHRDLALALRLRPGDRRIASELRRVDALRRPEPIASAAPVAQGLDDDPSEGRTEPPLSPFEDDEGLGEASATDAALAEELAQKLRANPGDRDVVLALADVLRRLGRDLELLALLSARLEETTDEPTRLLLAPLRVDVLRRLAEASRREGREGEAGLYETMLDSADETRHEP